jgi:hypothetical protein
MHLKIIQSIACIVYYFRAQVEHKKVLHSLARNNNSDGKKFLKSDPSLSPGYNSSGFRYIFIAALSLGFANILF